jgi:lysozyme family protein
MASFDLFLPILLKLEGGYVDDPDDPGGETNKGMTMAVFQHCSHELLGIDPTSENLKSLTDAQAGIIYKAKYWDKMNASSFTSQDLANIVCDFLVNAGTRATRLLQHLMNGMGASLVEDGAIGPATLAALTTVDQVGLYRDYKQARKAYYLQLAESRPSMAKFLKGWLNRVNTFPDSPALPSS